MEFKFLPLAARACSRVRSSDLEQALWRYFDEKSRDVDTHLSVPLLSFSRDGEKHSWGWRQSSPCTRDL